MLLRDFGPDDLLPATDMWEASWSAAMPTIDFAARRVWFGEHLAALAAGGSLIRVAEANGALAGLVTIDPATRYLDQLVVAPACWGQGVAQALVAEAAALSPRGLVLHVNTDNPRAVRFYRKLGFLVTGEAVSERSGLPLLAMERAGLESPAP